MRLKCGIQGPKTTFYQSAIVNTALFYTIFELFDVKEYHDLEIYVLVEENGVIVRSLVLSQYQQTDRQTDGRTGRL